MLLRQDTQIALNTSCVVIANILLDHLDKLVLAVEPSAIITFPLQNTPEALHWTVINAMRYAGHTLRHARLYELVVEGTVGVLETSVAMKQGMCVRISLHSFVEGFENQRIVVVLTERVRHNTPVTEIQNGAQIEFMDRVSLIPLEFRHISEPLFVGFCGIKLSIQKIFSKVLRILCLSGAAPIAVLDCRTDISDPADAEHTLVIDMDAVVMAQIVIEPPVALVRAFGVELFEFFCKPFILCGPLAQLSGSPFVVSRTCHMEQFTGQFDWIPLFLVCFPDRGIDMALSYFRKASLLSISSNFFSRSRSISAKYS